MTQSIIAYTIIIVAVGYTIYSIVRKLKNNKDRKSCSDCSCCLKNCQKTFDNKLSKRQLL